MRLGAYPGKRDSLTVPYGSHRVIVPIFIPQVDGYFEQSLTILGYTLESLRRSTAARASVTLIANACHPAALAVLQQEREKGWIDQLVVNEQNRGKADALRSAMHGSFEPIITVSDGDVLFHQGWVEAVDEVFAVFPEAASVAPIPNPTVAWSNNATTTVGAFLKRELAYRDVVPQVALKRFASSLENPHFYSADHYKSQLSVVRDGRVACVGNGHFCVSLRREVLARVPRAPTQRALGQDTEQSTLDLPPDSIGGWKLATVSAWVSHLGNVAEAWMEEEFEELCPELEADALLPQQSVPPFRRSRLNWLPRRLRSASARVVRRCVRQSG